jgi:hypothetical protein
MLHLCQLPGWLTSPRSITRSQRSFFTALVIGFTLVMTQSARAQEKPPEIKLTVTNVEGDLALYNPIKITVENLQEWVKKPENDYRKFVLYIDGNGFPGLKPDLVENNAKLRFDIKRVSDNQQNKEAWTAVLSRRPKVFSRPVDVTVGLENGLPIPSKASPSQLTVIKWFWFKIFVIGFLFAIGLFWWLAYASDIIRDTGAQPGGNNKHGKPNRKPFSLARTQMAFWFFIVVISYVFIWMVTTDLSSLTPSVLALIGISAATGLGAAVVDSNKQGTVDNQRRVIEEKRNSAEVELQRLQSEIATLTTDVAVVPAPANLDDLKTSLATMQAELDARQEEIDQANQEIAKIDAASKPAASKGFIDDILSDDGGVSFHRFQIFAWTIVLILVFVFSVINILAMPDFDATLLGLMGISGGTYLGFKLPNQPG